MFSQLNIPALFPPLPPVPGPSRYPPHALLSVKCSEEPRAFYRDDARVNDETKRSATFARCILAHNEAVFLYCNDDHIFTASLLCRSTDGTRQLDNLL